MNPITQRRGRALMANTNRLILPLLLVLTACGTTSNSTPTPAGSSAAPGAHVVSLSEWKVSVTSSLSAQKLTFQVANAGSQQHELLVFKSDLDPSRYPAESSGAIQEDGPGISKISDGDNLDPGKSQARTVDLTKPGKYLFVCNLPGHFKLGMYAVVEVK